MFYAPLPRTLAAALRDLSEKKPEVRASAARDLARHGEENRSAVLSALEKSLKDDHALVRATAAELLGELEATDLLPALLVAVEDDHQLVRQNAIMALGNLRDSRAQQRIERALSDERPEVRYQAVMAYPRVSSSREESVRALAQATRDDDDSIAHIAFRMAEELAADGEVDAALLLRAKACLAHGSARVRVVAAIVLATAKDPAGDRLLVEVAEGKLKTPENEDVAAVIELLGERDVPGGREALAKRAFGGLLVTDKFQWHARIALARLGDPRAKQAIVRDLTSLSFEKRTLAVAAAGRARLTDARAILLEMRGRSERASPGAVEAALEELAQGAKP